MREGHGGCADEVLRDVPAEDAPVRHPTLQASDDGVEGKLGEREEPRELEAAEEDVFVQKGAHGVEREDDDAQVNELLTIGQGEVRRRHSFEKRNEPHPMLRMERPSLRDGGMPSAGKGDVSHTYGILDPSAGHLDFSCPRLAPRVRVQSK